MIVNYNRAEREAAGFHDHISDAQIINRHGEIIHNKGYNVDLPFKVKFDDVIFQSWWLPLESLQHEGLAGDEFDEEEVPEEEKVVF